MTFSKAKKQLAPPYINKEQQAKAFLDDTAVSTRAVHQPRSAKRKHIWPRGISTTISRAKGHLAQQAMTFSQAKMQLAQPYINKKQQSESTSGPHSRVDQSGISTAISKGQLYLEPWYINHDQQSEGTFATAGHDV